MRHAIILAHPTAASFNGAIASRWAEAVRGFGHEAVVRDLYRLDFDPRLHAREIPWAADYAPGDDVVAERDALADAKVIVLVYPLWFNAPPAMLKGYVDRVFGHGFGFNATANDAEPLLRGRCLVSLTTSGAPDGWIEQTGAVRALRAAFDDHIAELTGLAVMDHHHFGAVTPGMSPTAASIRLNAVGDLARRLFAPAQG